MSKQINTNKIELFSAAIVDVQNDSIFDIDPDESFQSQTRGLKTPISENFYYSNIEVFRTCPTLPLTGKSIKSTTIK